MFRNVSINKIESNIIFYENAVKIIETSKTPHLSQGFKITEEKVEKIESEFQYVNYMQSSFDLWAKGRQNVSFDIVSADFVDTGVEIYDFEKADDGVQKLDLLYGNKWKKNTTEPVAIVDLDTAMLLYGYENVVGKYLSTNYGDLRIVGVVSNTIERQQEISQAQKRGDYIADYLFETHAYVPRNYYKSLNLPTYNNDVIISDDNMTPDEIKTKLKQILDIPLEEDKVFISREDVVYKNIMGREVFFQIIISITSVFSILGCLNLININLYTFNINKKSIGIYKIIGHKDRQIIWFSIFENFVKSIICVLSSILVSNLILILITSISGSIKFVDFRFLILLCFVLILIFIFVSVLIHAIISFFSVKKTIDYFMEES